MSLQAEVVAGRTVTPDTPFFSFSVGKAVSATIAHRFVEQGVFSYGTRVAELWPDFAKHGLET